MAGTLVSLLPRSLELKAGRLLGRFLLIVSGRRKNIAEENIRRCLPELNPEKHAELLRKNFEHYGILALELLHMFSPFPGHYFRYVKKNCSIEGRKNWEEANAKGKGVLFISAHLANWEIMAVGSSLTGMQTTVITRQLKPAWLDRKIVSLRQKAGCRSVYKENRLGAVLKGLRNKTSVGFVLDQYIAPPVGVLTRFFTAQVYTMGVMGLFSKRTEAPIVPVSQVRDEKGNIHILFEPPIYPENIPQDQTAFTELLSLKIEEWIRKNPDQWLWGHRRFKNAVWSDPNGAEKMSDSNPL